MPKKRIAPFGAREFPGEDHGFRAAENIIRAFEAELSLYGQLPAEGSAAVG